ncbi:hypothetical protein COX86_03765 [Candidatus Micrarchaeota archaeon CG_4_10_14_0_2_um_filter_60_11]|nr:MAG: hypothetical protein AUJ16_02340 [Candidatus Micrarchaeota archaeon CG1_02_60_51]PIN96584.1 MAG: hypothetical protein COU39_00575 [Candidatus Micrarchaeota archaeon CG10_big_fil_rev_8_21_14_0_10_60_32]PIO02191.1 MAG: hypothetical protein COT58_01280 [Candidatus Micrarchaeota archaeon CG09_land_8_20_14_0_10_60_16]PIY91602.1 MAG: hypothetical protein COY71_02305 [Candidatus Micrarchaeota archaeon CG_4_10_14_0_8_um_filter_60_7]PIZ90660.1 MAG: hypothetical protein COX86_03765 [Candidatus Mi
MAYQGKQENALLAELPHALVLILLLLVLLVVLTKFGWVQCSQVPGNWCQIYCEQVMRTHSRVILLSGDSGMGDPAALEMMVRHVRPYTYLEPYQSKYLTYGMLDGADLVILEKMDTVSFTQALAIKKYLQGGGAALWIGDSATKFYTDDYEIARARVMDEEAVYAAQAAGQTLADPHYYENALNNASTQRGFYLLSDVLMADFVSSNSSTVPIGLSVVDYKSLLVSGLFADFPTSAKNYTVVVPNTANTHIVAMIKANGKEYPGIYETRYAGKVVYVAFPLEEANSTTLVQNVLDYLVTC